MQLRVAPITDNLRHVRKDCASRSSYVCALPKRNAAWYAIRVVEIARDCATSTPRKLRRTIYLAPRERPACPLRHENAQAAPTSAATHENALERDAS